MCCKRGLLFCKDFTEEQIMIFTSAERRKWCFHPCWLVGWLVDWLICLPVCSLHLFCLSVLSVYLSLGGCLFTILVTGTYSNKMHGMMNLYVMLEPLILWKNMSFHCVVYNINNEWQCNHRSFSVTKTLSRIWMMIESDYWTVARIETLAVVTLIYLADLHEFKFC